MAILGSTLAKAPVTSVESMMEAIRIELGEKKARFLEGNKKALLAGHGRRQVTSPFLTGAKPPDPMWVGRFFRVFRPVGLI